MLLHHNNHLHPQQNLVGRAGEFVTATDHDADSYYEIRLTVTDSAGGSTRVVSRIDPRPTQLTLRSDPPGAKLSYAGVDYAAEQTFTVAEGFQPAVDAEPTRIVDGRVLVFAGWSDGGAQRHTLTIGATPTTLVARYVPEALDVLGGTAGGLGQTPVAPTPASPAPPSASTPAATPTPQPRATPRSRGTVRIGFDRPWRGRRTAPVRVLTGRIRGTAPSVALRVGVRRPVPRQAGRCREWSARRGRFGAVRRCSSAHPLVARVTRVRDGVWRWRVALRGRLAQGPLLLSYAAEDARGQGLDTRTG